MEPNEIIEGNKLIADFMGWQKGSEDGFYQVPNLYPLNTNDYHWTEWHVQSLGFNYNWSDLMPVVDKIERMKYKIDDDGTDAVYNYAFLRTFSFDPQHGYLVRFNRYPLHESTSRIEAMWNAVVDFIKTYNEKQEDFYGTK